MLGLGLALALKPSAKGSSGAPFSPSFTLTNVSANTPGAGQYLKNLNTYAWDAKAVAGPYTGDMSFTIRPTSVGSDFVFGFDASAAAGSNTDMDACVYYGVGPATFDYTNGVIGVDHGAHSPAVTEKIRRSGNSVIYSRDGVDKKTWTISAATPLYFIMGFAVYNSYITFVGAETL